MCCGLEDRLNKAIKRRERICEERKTVRLYEEKHRYTCKKQT